MNKLRVGINFVLSLGLLGGGIATLAWLAATRPEPGGHEVAASVPTVQATQVRAGVFDEPIVGYGNLRPEKQVRVVPNVSGRLVFSHPDLAEGKTIAKDELLFEIDPIVYQAQVDSANAGVRRLEASIKRQQEELASLDGRIKVSQRMVDIAEQEFNASTGLGKTTLSGVQLHADEQSYLRLKAEVLELDSRVRLIPLTIAETEAQLDAARAGLKQAEHDLENTRILCPFDARVEAVSARSSQYVTALLAIATLTDLAAFEISAVVDPRELRWIHDDVTAAARGDEGSPEAPHVVVRWSLFGHEYEWNGRVTRFERLDEATRMARIAVELRGVDLGLNFDGGSDKPPISIGMFCRAEIPARPVEAALVVPRHAIQDQSFVYVFEDDPASSDPRLGRLGVRRVPMLRSASDEVLVDFQGRDESSDACELADGDRVIVSPLSRPVPGMSIRLGDELVAEARSRRDSAFGSSAVRLVSAD